MLYTGLQLYTIFFKCTCDKNQKFIKISPSKFDSFVWETVFYKKKN